MAPGICRNPIHSWHSRRSRQTQRVPADVAVHSIPVIAAYEIKCMTPVFAPAKSLFAPRTKRMLECSIFSLAPGREQKPSCQRVRSHGDCKVQPVLFAEQTTTIVSGFGWPKLRRQQYVRPKNAEAPSADSRVRRDAIFALVACFFSVV